MYPEKAEQSIICHMFLNWYFSFQEATNISPYSTGNAYTCISHSVLPKVSISYIRKERLCICATIHQMWNYALFQL